MEPLFNTATLAASFDRRVAPGEDFLNLICPNRFQSDSEQIVIDDVLDDERIGKYVSADVETPEGEKIEREARSYEPTYVKERDTVKPSEGQKRRAGESLFGVEGLAGDRLEAAVEDQLDAHHNRITRVEILQANQMIQTGQVSVTGKHSPNRVINFNRDAALSGANAWGPVAGGSILENLEARSDRLGEIGGAMGRILILGSTAKNAFVNDPDIKENLDNRRATDAQLELNVLASDKKNVLRYVGSIGDLTVWKYVQSYKDAANVRRLFMPSNGSVLIDPEEFHGFLAHGAIKDIDAGIQALPRFAKTKVNFDPSGLLVLTQSSPLAIPGNINACDFWTVN